MHFLYLNFLKPILFLFDPEDIHDLFTGVGSFLGRYALTKNITAWFFSYQNPGLEQEILGIKFKNPIGLAAGFDKNGLMTDVLPAVGFGFAEIGSVTGKPCTGNTKPRLWRLPNSKSLIVYYGLKNDGAEKISQRLSGKNFNIPIGISLAKTNDEKTVTTEAGIADYLFAYEKMREEELGDYYTINISCPNAFGGQPFNDPARLELLLKKFAETKFTKPIFLKMPPDLTETEVDQIISLARTYKISGFICTNLTKDRGNEVLKNKIKDILPTDKGGFSGKVVADLANNQIKYIYQKTKSEFVIIGCGGVFNAEDAYQKIRLGASLIQMITGMIFEGPQVVSEINQGLAFLIQKDGFKNISEAVGVDNK